MGGGGTERERDKERETERETEREREREREREKREERKASLTKCSTSLHRQLYKPFPVLQVDGFPLWGGQKDLSYASRQNNNTSLSLCDHIH